MVSYIMGRLNHHAVDNDDVKFYPSDNPLEYPSDSVPDPENTPIKSIADDEMYQILEIFNSYHDDDILDVYI